MERRRTPNGTLVRSLPLCRIDSSHTQNIHNRSPDFEAGQLFERMLKDNSSHVSRADFLKLYEKLRPDARDRTARKGDTFEAGRIFERYDKKKNGTMTKKDFVNFFNDYNRSRDFPLTERRPYLSSELRYGYDSPRRLVSPILHDSEYHRRPILHDSDYHRRSILLDPDHHRRVRFDSTIRMPQNLVRVTDPLIAGSPRRVRHFSDSDSNVEHRLLLQLDRKIRLLIQQSENVKRRMVDIQDACEETERETVHFFQPMIDRVRDVESRLLAGLQRDLDVINQEADLVNTYVFSSFIYILYISHALAYSLTHSHVHIQIRTKSGGLRR